jgi:hypothetical protein
MITIDSSFQQENLIFDRVVGDFISLPYAFDKIQIPVNELSVAGAINIRFNYLYENLLYLYSRTKILTNQIPYSYTSWLGLNRSILSGPIPPSWNSTIVPNTSARRFQDIGLSGLDYIQDFVVSPTTDGQNIVLIGSSDDTIFFTKFDNQYSSFNVILSSIYIDEKTQLKNGNITDLVLNGNDLYVIDSTNNRVLLYDVEGFIGGENVKFNKRYLKKIIGGQGGRYDNNEFNNPYAADLYLSTLVVMDSGNSCLKFFDDQLNWRYSLILKNLFSLYTIVDIKLHKNQFTGITEILLLSKENKIIIVNIADSSYKVIDFSEETSTNEYAIKYLFSKQNTNIFYILTNKSVYKKYFSRPTTKIGKFDLSKDNIQYYNLRAFDLYLDGDRDSMLLFSRTDLTSLYNITAGQFFRFLEPNTTNNMLYSYDFDIFSKDQIHIKNEEYSQSLTFNKSISKLINNNYVLLNQSRQRFKFDLDPYLPLSAVDIQMTNQDIYESYKFIKNIYIDDGVLTDPSLNVDCNNFIGNNENYQSDTINRCLYKLYLQQLGILNVIQGDTPFPIPLFRTECNIITIKKAEDMQGVGDGAFIISIICN